MGYQYSSANFYQMPQQPMFPQPNGNVYLIQNSLEVANIPTGAGVTLALCLPENLLYIKTLQNATPNFQAYKLENFNSPVTPIKEDNSKNLEERIKILEQKIQEIGTVNNNDSTTNATSNQEWDA